MQVFMLRKWKDDDENISPCRPNDVTAAILAPRNNEKTTMLVNHTNPVGVELFSYVNSFFATINFYACWTRGKNPFMCNSKHTKVLSNKQQLTNRACALFCFDLLVFFSGQTSRFCAGSETSNATWLVPNFSECVSPSYKTLHQEVCKKWLLIRRNNKHLMTGSEGNREFCFPRILLDFGLDWKGVAQFWQLNYRSDSHFIFYIKHWDLRETKFTVPQRTTQ